MIKKFKIVDDGYIKEGLYCSIYGAVLRSRNFLAGEELMEEVKPAVEEALRKSNTAEAKSTKPGDKQGKQTDDSDTKINNVSALNSLLDGK